MAKPMKSTKSKLFKVTKKSTDKKPLTLKEEQDGWIGRPLGTVMYSEVNNKYYRLQNVNGLARWCKLKRSELDDFQKEWMEIMDLAPTKEFVYQAPLHSRRRQRRY